MKRGTLDLLRITQFPLIIACGMLPVPMILFGYLAPNLLAYAWVLPLAYLVLTVISFFVPGKLRAVYGILTGTGMILPWIFFAKGQSLIVALLAALVFASLLFWSTRIGGWPSDQELHSAWLGACIGFQFLGQAVFYLDGLTEAATLSSQVVWFVISFLIMAILIILSLNRNALNAITKKRPQMAVMIRKKNVFLVVVLFGIAIVFSLVPSMAGGMIGFFAWLLRTYTAIFHTDSELPPETTVPEMKPGQQVPDFGIELNVGLHTDILNVVFMVVAAVVLVVAIPVLLYFIGKNVYSTVKKLWKKLITDVANNLDDYEDEVTDTRNSVIDDRAENTRAKRRSFLYNDRGMGAQERVRYRYKYLLGRHPEWQKGSTARENLPEETAVIYERARYSPHPISAEEAERFKTETKKM